MTWTIAEASLRLHLSPATIRGYVKRGTLKADRISGRLYIPDGEMESLIDSRLKRLSILDRRATMRRA